MANGKAQNIGIIGLGRMGRCLVQGLLESKSFGKEQIFFTTKHDADGEGSGG